MKSIVDVTDVDSGNVRFSLVNYDWKARIVFPLKQYSERHHIRKAIDETDLTDSKRSNLVKAFHALKTKVFRPKAGDRKWADNVVILITDDSKERSNAKQVKGITRYLKKKKVDVLALGIGQGDFSNLRKIVSKPSDMAVMGSYAELSGFFTAETQTTTDNNPQPIPQPKPEPQPQPESESEAAPTPCKTLI